MPDKNPWLDSSINIAYLGREITADQVEAWEMAWDDLRGHSEWFGWVETYVNVHFPNLDLYMEFDDPHTEHKIRAGRKRASLKAPAREIAEAEEGGTLTVYYQGLMRDLYAAWAKKVDVPEPPPLPE